MPLPGSEPGPLDYKAVSITIHSQGTLPPKVPRNNKNTLAVTFRGGNVREKPLASWPRFKRRPRDSQSDALSYGDS